MKSYDFIFLRNKLGITHLLVMALLFLILSPALQAQAPTATTDAASEIESNSAKVNATVNANDVLTTVTFEYGLDTNYGDTFEAEQSPLSGSTNTAVSAILYELTPNMTYHFRVVAQNANGTTNGADMTFTTMELPPTAETAAATAIEADGATLNGMVFGRGYDTDVTFEYGLDTGYGTTVAAEQSPLLNPENTVNFPVSKVINGLSNNTTYHYRVVASNDNGTSYGTDMNFTIGTVGTAPTATTNVASEISSGSATLNGTVNANDSQTIVTFEYGLDTNYGDTFEADQSPVSGSTNTAVSATINELEPNTTYHFRVVAQNANGTTNGADMTFTTLPSPPTAFTNTVSTVSATAATLNGTVNANGASTTVTFQFGSDTNYGTTVTADQSPVTGNTDTPVSKTISGLTSGISYHYRVAATNASGSTYGMDMIFTVGVSPPTATTNAASEVGSTTATLNGTINANNNITTATFEYGPDTNYGRTVTATPGTITGSSNTSVTASISNLLANTTYHYRAVGINTGGTANGADMTFTTGTGPLVTTNAATVVGSSGATLNGMVNAHGENTTVTFEYGLTTAYGTTVTADQSPVTGASNTAVSKTLSFLSPSTTYHYRVVGQNASGTTYGTNKIFSTSAADPDAPTAITNAATAVGATGATLSGTVTSMNHSTIVTFEYGLNTAYEDTVPADQSPVSSELSTTVTKVLAGLISDTTYHYRVGAKNDFGSIYGTDMTFYTSTPAPPTAVTNAASSVSTGGAALNATVNANNTTIYSITFEYGTTTAYGISVLADPFTVSGIYNTAVSQSISGLTNNTLYHYRVVVQSALGFIYGSDTTFTTGLYTPIATTNPVSAVGTTSATLNGTVNANNSTVTVTFEYGLTTNYGRISIADQSPVSGDTNVAVSNALTELQPNSTYHYRVVAQNSEDTAYGEDMTFTTSGTPPLATTNAATAVSSTGATLNGTVKANNENTNVTFEYGLTDAYGTTYPADQNPVTGNAFTPVSKTITGLTDNTTYHYRVVAQNGSGTTKGSDLTFFTGAATPTAITNAATEIGSTIATLNGTVIANNASTTVTFEFGADTSYGRTVTANPNTLSGSINTEVKSQLTNLLPSTTYHYRVVAVNSAGAAYGADEAFVTSAFDDTDGDGVSDGDEGTGDRDGDGIPNYQDYDPTGYFYDETNAELISDGQITVSGPGAVSILYDGANGYYQFTTDGTAGIYTIGVTLPPGYIWSPTRLVTPGALNPTGYPNPYVLGNGEDSDKGFLTSNDTSRYYLQFDLEADDPIVFNNNFPLRLEIMSAQEDEFSIPTEYALSQNYPNPFNPVTTIAYALPKLSFVNLSIYNIKGQLVKTLVNEQQTIGYHTIQWNAVTVSSGIYFYKLTIENYTITRKMILLR
jgi:phosphodiesterase/alkaline phosphatase D-like protein